MAIRVQRHTNVNKQATLLAGLTLARSNGGGGGYVGVAEIDLFMKV